MNKTLLKITSEKSFEHKEMEKLNFSAMLMSKLTEAI